MALKPISEMRRSEIAAAALAVFTTEGPHALTLERVAKEIGASKGIILHYFTSKELLLARVIADVMGIVGREFRTVLGQATAPQDRLSAALAFAVGHDLYTPGYAQAWLSVMDKSVSDQSLARFRKIIFGRLRSNFVFMLRPLVGRMEAAPVAESLIALIEGLWVRRAVSPGSITSERARALLLTHLEESLSFQNVR